MNNIRFILSATALLFSLTLFSKNTQLKTEQAGISTFKRDKDSVHVAFWVKQTKQINTFRELIIQPEISNGDNTLPLTTYAIRGRYNNKLHKRDSIFGFTNKQNQGNSVFVNSNPQRGAILYIDTVISYRPWMKDANLKLYIDLCGCGNKQGMIHHSRKLDYKLSSEEIHPFLVFSRLKTDESSRKNELRYTLYFRVNENIVDTSYLGNSKTLQILGNDLKFLSQNVFNISNAIIMGYASPEGSLSFNEKLAASRSFAFAEESRKLSYDPVFKNPETHLTDEDWPGLISGLESDTSDLAQMALNILGNGRERAEQKSELKHSHSGKVYDFLKKKYLDRLRKSDLIIKYELNSGKIAQAECLPEKMPRFVTYDSLFEYTNNIADSVKRAQIIYNAAETYSHHQAAVLNAGIMALKEKKIEKADAYLRSIEGDNNPSELDNALGVLAIYQGKYKEARVYFHKAKEKGLSEVETNISILDSLN